MRICPFEQLPPELQTPEVREYYLLLKKKRGYFVLRRILDVIIALILILVLLPFYLITAAAIVIDSGWPVLYLQQRVGQYGKPFAIFKFRTMIQNADKLGSAVTTNGDKRITRVGKWIRGLRLDEMPQAFNLLLGQMTLIGTRPEVQRYVEHYTPEQKAVLLLPPGMTGRASILFRNEAKLMENAQDADQVYIENILPRKMAENLAYLKEIGFITDFKLLINTFLCLFRKDELEP